MIRAVIQRFIVRLDRSSHPTPHRVHQAQSLPALAQLGIELDGTQTRRLGRVVPDSRVAVHVRALGVGVRQTGPGEGVIGVEGDGLLERPDRLLVLLGTIAPVGLPAFDVEVVGGKTPRRDRRDAIHLLRCQRGGQSCRDVARDLGLDGQDIGRHELAVERLGPQMRIGRGVDQLSRDANRVASSPRSAL